LSVFLISQTINGCDNLRNRSCTDLLKRYNEISLDIKSRTDTTLLLNVLGKILSKYPQCVDAYLIRGDLFFTNGNSKRAHFDYNTAILYDRNNVYAYYKLGLLCQEGESYDSSIYFLQTAINLKTDNGWIVDFHHLKKDVQTRSNEYDVTAVSLFYSHGISSYYRRSLTVAFKDFDFCIRSSYRVEKCYLFRGAIYEESNKHDSACNDFTMAKLYGNKEADGYLKRYCH
jgi:tetratricopeptide (TPR) repeat protein